MRARTAAVRPGTAFDADTLTWLEIVTRAAYFHPPGAPFGSIPRPTPHELQLWATRLAQPDPAVVLVAEVAGEAVGSLAVAPAEADDELVVEKFFVLPHLLARGIGSLLHDAFVEHANGTGRRRVRTEIWDVSPRHQDFHERAGWTEDGRVRTGPPGTRMIGMVLELPRERRLPAATLLQA